MWPLAIVLMGVALGWWLAICATVWFWGNALFALLGWSSAGTRSRRILRLLLGLLFHDSPILPRLRPMLIAGYATRTTHYSPHHSSTHFRFAFRIDPRRSQTGKTQKSAEVRFA